MDDPFNLVAGVAGMVISKGLASNGIGIKSSPIH
jgi:hypothetical protein